MIPTMANNCKNSSITVFPGSIARRWRELNGENHWKGLLDPIDIDLRYNIILYGELSQAIYDTFIKEKKSKFAGAPRFSRKDFLSNTAATLGQASMYEVTKYFYATSSIDVPESFIIKSLSREPWCVGSNWIGFVAVATDAGKAALGRRDILVGWRGTLTTLEWIEDFDYKLVPASAILRPGPSGKEPMVHRGWMSIYTSDDPRSKYNKDSARNQVLSEVRRLVNAYKQEEISISVTGHSLGGALATLNAIDIASNGFNTPDDVLLDKACPVAAFTLASPRVGDVGFLDAFAGTPDLRLLRVRNEPDPVTNYPLIGYADVGVEMLMDFKNSQYLKTAWSLPMSHNLECYLHGVAGTNGTRQEFKLAIDRDVALVNKGIDALKDEYLVPDSWWVPKDKCMVQGADGHWTLQDHEEDD